MAQNTGKKPGFFARVKGFFKGIAKFFRDTASEMKKVVWPSRKQVINNTIVVIVVVAVCTVCVLLLDMLFRGVLGVLM